MYYKYFTIRHFIPLQPNTRSINEDKLTYTQTFINQHIHFYLTDMFIRTNTVTPYVNYNIIKV